MFYLLTNGGDVRYPPNGLRKNEPDRYRERIADLFDSGFYFHYNGYRNHIVSYLKGATNIGGGDQLVRNQFYAVYYGNSSGDELLSEFRQKVESTFNAQGWQTAESNRGGDEIYTNLVSANSIELSVELEKIRRVVDNYGMQKPAQLGAPDYISAFRVCKTLIREFADIRITICTAGVTEDLPDSDIVIIPKATREAGAPTGDTKEQFDLERLNQRINETTQEITQFVTVDGEIADSRVDALAEAFESERTSDLNIRIDTEERKETKALQFKKAGILIGGLSSVPLLAALFAALGLLKPTLEILHLSVSIELGFFPGISSGFPGNPYRSSTIIAVCAIFLVITLQRPLRAALEWLQLENWFHLSDQSFSESATEEVNPGKIASLTLQRMKNIRDDDVIEAAGGFDAVSDDIFSEITGLQVYDTTQYRLDNVLAAVRGGIKGIIFGSILTVLTASIGYLSGYSPALSLELLITLTVASLVYQSRSVVLAIIKKTRNLASERDFSRYQVVRGTVLLIGGVSASQMAAELVWQRSQSFTYNLIIGFAAEILKFPVRVGVEVLFFGVLGLFLVTLLYASTATTATTALIPRTLLVTTVGGLALLWFDSPIYTTNYLWLAAFVVGTVVAGIVLRSKHTRPAQAETAIRAFTLLFVTVVFFEAFFGYSSPLIYDTASNQFTLVSGSFSGYRYPVSVGTISRTILYATVTGGMVIVLFGGSLSDERTAVLVFGPEETDPPHHVLQLFNHAKSEPGLSVETNEWLKHILDHYDKTKERTSTIEIFDPDGISPVSFTTEGGDTHNLLVWAPMTDRSLTGKLLFEKLQVIQRRSGPNFLPEEAISSTPGHEHLELATAIGESDILVLLFSAEKGNKLSEGSEKVNQYPVYLDRYKELLEKHVNPDQKVIGSVTNTRVVNKQIEEPPGTARYADVATKYAFRDCPHDTKMFILSHLDNYENDRLPVAVETRNEGSIGITEEFEFIRE